MQYILRSLSILKPRKLFEFPIYSENNTYIHNNNIYYTLIICWRASGCYIKYTTYKTFT